MNKILIITAILLPLLIIPKIISVYDGRGGVVDDMWKKVVPKDIESEYDKIARELRERDGIKHIDPNIEIEGEKPPSKWPY